MLQRIREGLTLALIAALPFHAFLVTVGTKMIAGPGHAPLPMLALWKEALFGVILIVALVEWVMESKTHKAKRNTDLLDLIIGGLLLLALVQFFVFHVPTSPTHFAFGFKYDFLPLVAFLLLRRVPWSPKFISTGGAVLLGVGAIVAVYGVAAMFLPMSWFTWLGYSDLHSLYIPGGSLAPFQQIESIGIRRMQSTLSGPNQLGIWLLIPLSVGIFNYLRARRFLSLLVCLFIGSAILLTFSRAAWIAAGVIAFVVAWKHLPRRQLLPATCSLLTLVIIAIAVFPQVILRATSSAGHIERPLQALQVMKEHPLGLGLGTAGPASNRFSDTCVELPAGADATWAEPHPELCVFVGGQQIQPLDRMCSCPLLPENWYLQIGVELGWLGFVLYVWLTIMLVLRSIPLKMENVKLNISFSIFHFPFSIFLAFLGISIAALFLHAWEDAAVAYTVWIVLATVLDPSKRNHRA